MKVYSIIFSILLSFAISPSAHAFSIHQNWSCQAMVDHQGKPVLGGPQVSLLCLLVPDRTGRFVEKSCTVTQTMGTYPRTETKSIQFPLSEGISSYPFLDHGQLSVEFDQYIQPFFYRALVYTASGRVGCLYSAGSELAHGMQIDH